MTLIGEYQQQQKEFEQAVTAKDTVRQSWNMSEVQASLSRGAPADQRRSAAGLHPAEPEATQVRYARAACC
ncbi:hypothetical protein M8494_32885 [Serratia ureilytica]